MTIDLAALSDNVLPMVAFCIGIYFFTAIVRGIVEARWPAVCKNTSWKKILRTLPPLFGGVAAAVMYKYPFLCTLPSWGTRFIYGCFGGGIASFAYLIFKAVIQKYFGVKVEKGLGESDSPPPNQE